MIITCPQCDTRFVVPSTVFMRGGRQVRCATCKHTWYQDPPDDTPDYGVMDDDISSSEERVSKGRSGNIVHQIKQDITSGYPVIIGMIALVLLVFFGMRMMSPSLIVGEGLAFDHIVVKRHGRDVKVTGTIVNTRDSIRGVPHLEVQQILGQGHEGDSRIIQAPIELLESGAHIEFSFDLHNIGDEVKDLRVTFKANDGESIKETETTKPEQPSPNDEKDNHPQHH